MSAVVRRSVSLLMAGLLVVGVVSASPASAADGPTLSVGDQSGLERDAVTGSVFVPIYLSEPAAAPVVVSYWTVDGTATAGTDYTPWGTPASPRTVTIPAGSVQTQVNLSVLADDDIEDDETFSLVATAAGGDVVVGDDTGTATIIDADAVSTDNPAVTVTNPTVVEGDTGQRRAQFLVHLSRAPLSPLTLTYATTDGTAVAGQDYVAKLPGSVVFAPGQISKTIDVLVNSDDSTDAPRSFTLAVAVTGGSPVEELNMAGAATITDDDTPPAPAVVVTSSLNSDHSCALMSTGKVRCYGANDRGQLGDGTTVASVTARDVQSDAVFTSLGESMGKSNCAVTSLTTVQCWGYNGHGQLGDGTRIDRPGPVSVAGLDGVTSVSVGQTHACALLQNRTLRCWGQGYFGALGAGSLPGDQLSPVAVTGLTGVTGVYAGNLHTCATTESGDMYCWGANTNGSLGDGTDVQRNTPVKVLDVRDAVDVELGSAGYTCVVEATSAVRCWGSNNFGAIGLGSRQNSFTPVLVSALDGVLDIATGYSHTCGLFDDGTMTCVGFNGDGQLGDGTTTSRRTFAPVSGLTAGVTSIDADAYNTCAATPTSRYCWGRNTSGQLGDGANVNRTTPVLVTAVP